MSMCKNLSAPEGGPGIRDVPRVGSDVMQEHTPTMQVLHCRKRIESGHT